MTTVRDNYGLACPKCGSDEHIVIAITTMVRLYPEGTDAPGDHEWSDRSLCACKACGYRDHVARFSVTGSASCE